MQAPDDSGIFELAPEPVSRAPARSVALAAARDLGPSVPCPHCRYDLRGGPFSRCPECGKTITQTRLMHAQRERERTWRDRPGLIAAMCTVFGLLVTLGVDGAAASAGGVSVGGAMLVGSVVLLVSLATACGVYFGCAMLWIGWSQPVGTTMLQVAAAYGLGFAAASVLGLVPIPLLPWLVSVAILVGLLMKFLDIDARDAIFVAVLAAVVRLLIVIIVASVLLAGR